jgi:hypothetical protein
MVRDPVPHPTLAVDKLIPPLIELFRMDTTLMGLVLRPTFDTPVLFNELLRIVGNEDAWSKDENQLVVTSLYPIQKGKSIFFFEMLHSIQTSYQIKLAREDAPQGGGIRTYAMNIRAILRVLEKIWKVDIHSHSEWNMVKPHHGPETTA